MQKENTKYNSIEKAIQILLKFQEGGGIFGVRELSQELNFSPATVQRILQTLKDYNFVDQDTSSRQYFLGNVFYGFLQTLHDSNRITRTARKFMEQVAGKTEETVHLNIIDDSHRICIDTMESTRPLRAGMPLGHRSPLYAGASAKCLLAFSSPDFIANYLKKTEIIAFTSNTLVDKKKLNQTLKNIRKKKFAASMGERTPGLGSVSAPVLDSNGAILASISLAIPEIRYSQKQYLEKCVTILTTAAVSLSKTMGYKGS